jgi:hypothetical protein
MNDALPVALAVIRSRRTLNRRASVQILHCKSGFLLGIQASGQKLRSSSARFGRGAAGDEFNGYGIQN